MSASPRLTMPLIASIAIGVLLASTPKTGHAQYRNDFDEPFADIPDYDFQWFEPTDLDLNRQPIRADQGFFFHYDKLYLALTSERTTIGDPDVVVLSEIFRRDNSAQAQVAAAAFPEFLIDGVLPTAPPQFQVQNGILNAPPRSEFGYADRYEMGYVGQSGKGFSIGVIDGNEIESEQIFGFQSVDAAGNPVASLNGFGSVFVNFRTPPGLLTGLRDLGFEAIELDDGVGLNDDDDFGAGFGPTAGGVGNNNGLDGVPDIIDIDDLSFNGGTVFILDANGDGVFQFGVDPFFFDFGDATEFNFRFNQLGVRNINIIDGIEIMRTHRLSNRHWQRKHQNQRIEIGYGARLLRLQDKFLFDGVGDFAGRTFADTEAENQIVGPQARIKWEIQQGRWNVGIDGRVLLGVNIGDLSQTYGVGEALQPGALNRPLIFAPTFGSNGRQERTFSPVVEFRADLKYQLTRSMSLNLGYTATFIDNITRASQIVDYTLPNIGLLSGGEQDVFVNGVNFGVEFWH